METEVKDKLVKRRTDLICLVCGGQARCSHFGAVCCDACKVFFRRAILEKRIYSCIGKNDCEIDRKSKRCCSACRLVKCFNVGMERNWVINSPRSGHNISQPIVKPNVPIPNPGVVKCTLKLSDDDIEIVDNLYSISLKTINDVPVPDEFFIEEPTFTDIINVLTIIVKRMIAFGKSFSQFMHLDIADQIIILKAASLEIMLTRKASSLTSEVNEEHGVVWLTRNGKFVFTKQNLAKAYDKTLYNLYMKYITFLVNLELDDKALVILTCICLFSPDREGLSVNGRRELEREQLKYVNLLERYLHSNYSCEKARRTFPGMLTSQCSVREVSHYYNKAVMNCSMSDIQPLMKEFFDLE